MSGDSVENASHVFLASYILYINIDVIRFGDTYAKVYDGFLFFKILKMKGQRRVGLS